MSETLGAVHASHKLSSNTRTDTQLTHAYKHTRTAAQTTGKAENEEGKCGETSGRVLKCEADDAELQDSESVELSLTHTESNEWSSVTSTVCLCGLLRTPSG